jgi:hypothetical protein
MGYYSKDNECTPCDSLCDECTASGCTKCKTNAKLDNCALKYGTCVCIDGYYKSGSQCNQCTDPLCKTCGSTGSSCSACVENTTGATSPCACEAGYYKDGSRCSKCPYLAATCAAPFNNPASNLVCVSGAQKSSDSLSCGCIQGYYFWENQCKSCPGVLCKTCQYGVCTECTSPNSSLAKGLCYCNSG